MHDAPRRYERVIYQFSDEEKAELSALLARETQRVLDLKERKKAVAAQFAAEVKEGETVIANLALKVTNGYEPREVEAMLLMDTPRPGTKTIVRIDTKEEVRSEPMTAAEQQQSFGFGEAASND